MAKSVIYVEEARRLYVEQGFPLDAIVGMLNNKVSRRQLFNWKKDGEWDLKRKAFLAQDQDLSNQIMKLAQLTIQNALSDPSPKNLLAFSRAIAVLKTPDALRLLANETTEADREKITKTITPETLNYIKQVIYGLK
jgi:hypothetical protein